MITIDTVKKIPGFFKFEIKRAYIYFSFSWFSACSCSLWSVALLQLKTWRFKTLNSHQGIASSVLRAIFDWPSKVICDCIGFILLRSVIGLRKRKPFFQPRTFNPRLHWLISFTLLHSVIGPKKLTPVYQPMRFKTKTIAIASTVFACFHLEFSLASWIYFLCPDLRLILLWFWF